MLSPTTGTHSGLERPVSETPSPETFVLYGAGRVGTTIATVLAGTGRAVIGVASPTGESARRAAVRLGCDVFDDPTTMVRGADIVLIGAPDAELENAAAVIEPGVGRGAFVCHFSGASDTQPLASLEARGAQTAALHPVQSFADVDSAPTTIAGCAWGVTCDDGTYPRADGLVRSLKGTPVKVAPKDRVIWHAAAVISSNGLAALLAASERLLTNIDVERPLEVLLPLARGTLENIARSSSAAAALTGPVVRGEASTIARHLASLDERGEGTTDSYRKLSQMILEIARSSGRIDQENGRAIEAVLGP